MASAWADGTTVTFRVPDPGYRLAGVRLSQDVRIPGDQLTDPGNPRQADGAFGPKSVLEFAAYRPPGWLTALVGPGSRDDWYSAHPAYSLGGLAMLHARCHDRGAFAGLFLQSGSFFWPRFDGHESWFGYYPRITAFVAGVSDGDPHLTRLICQVCR